MGNCYVAGPNEALVVSGGCCSADSKKVVIAGYAWAWDCVSDVQTISLEVMTVNPRCELVKTAQGVAVTATGVCHVKIMTEPRLLQAACEQFLGKSTSEIENAVLQTLEGHLRAVLYNLTVEEIYRDRDNFATLVREVASPDLGRMGIEILSFVIKDIIVDQDIVDSLSKTQTAGQEKC